MVVAPTCESRTTRSSWDSQLPPWNNSSRRPRHWDRPRSIFEASPSKNRDQTNPTCWYRHQLDVDYKCHVCFLFNFSSCVFLATPSYSHRSSFHQQGPKRSKISTQHDGLMHRTQKNLTTSLIRGHYITNPNNALSRENPAILPYICIVWSPLKWVIQWSQLIAKETLSPGLLKTDLEITTHW